MSDKLADLRPEVPPVDDSDCFADSRVAAKGVIVMVADDVEVEVVMIRDIN
jgi:hypothetical protein